ncbi:MAG TPA: phosphatidylserine/phosphatidylglycerophosphate/cardiolipin synthase family protein [Opitutaceae bacterium]|nr:phosphatidylserine/phosphatidylglycerophosphate/cardiolipin synthase family protein [Opitutaceae bacterium]
MPSTRQARWLPTVDEGYRHMLAVVEQARTSVRLETYIFKADGPGGRFGAALRVAAERGVRVRVLLDSFGSSELPADFWDGLRAAGGEARFFNPLNLRRIVFRDHRKLLVADEDRAVVGGFNIAPEYEGNGVERGWRDLGLALEGEAARRLAASFDVMWDHCEFRHPRGFRLRLSRLKRLLRERGSAEVIATGPGLGRNQFRTALMRSLRTAREVRIAAAYFVPGFRLRRALARVARRGGRVQLLLAGKSDVAVAQAAGRTYYAALLRVGVEIAEYQPQILHAKLALVDDTVFAGSSNLDARSLDINYEIMVRLADPTLAGQGRAIFAADWARARRITRRGWRRTRSWLDRWAGTVAWFLLTKVDPWLARRQLRRLT